MNYLQRFEAAVSTLLGGQDMAEEFYRSHPEQVNVMRASCAYHRAKGGASWKGARIYFRWKVRPILTADRLAACQRPIDRIEDCTGDGRR